MPISNDGRGVGITVLVALLAGLPLGARQDSYDLLLRGGHVIDPANEIDGVRDVAIRNGRIVRVAASIPTQSAKRTVDLSGLYVVPGLVDIHSHQCGYSGALFPDDVALPAGTTTVVDAGGPGWRNFEDYREKISTAMDKTSLLLPRADMMTTLSKFLNMGVPIEQLLERVTVRAARAIKRPELASSAKVVSPTSR